MRFFSDLSHINEEFVIVKVICWNNNEEIGSTLVQAPTVEEAEAKGIMKLRERIGQQLSGSQIISTEISKKNNHSSSLTQQTKENQIIKEQIPLDPPSDWTAELAEFDLQIKRIGWDREQEADFIQSLLGLSHRRNITDYGDLELINKILKDIKKGVKPSDLKYLSDRSFLIAQSNSSLSKLSWSTEQARTFLFNNFNVRSRNDLTTKELIRFNITINNMLD